MTFRIAFAGLLLSVLIGTAASAAEQGNVYLWRDKDGTPHYGDRPPEGAESDSAKELSLRYKMTDDQAMAASAGRKAEINDAAQLRKSQQAEDKAAEKSEAQKVADERKAGCEAARQKQQQFETAHRLYRPQPDGTKTYLSDEELDATRADARRNVEKWCGQ